MAETMLRPSILVIVCALTKQFGVSVFVFQEKRVPFGGNCQTINLSLLFRLRIKIVSLDFQN